jgi:hypothetical protein
MDLSLGSKTISTTFFETKVQGNYSVVLGRDWIHANHCVLYIAPVLDSVGW